MDKLKKMEKVKGGLVVQPLNLKPRSCRAGEIKNGGFKVGECNKSHAEIDNITLKRIAPKAYTHPWHNFRTVNIT